MSTLTQPCQASGANIFRETLSVGPLDGRISQNLSVVKLLRRLLCVSWVIGLLAGQTLDAQVNPSNGGDQSVPNDVSTRNSLADPPAPTVSGSSQTAKPEDVVIINPSKTPLPRLPPDEFTDCMKQGPHSSGVEQGGTDLFQLRVCNAQIQYETHIVTEACVGDKGNTAPPRIIQACTELLNRQIFNGSDRFALFANRARGHFARGDLEQALADYDEAVKLAPRRAQADLYYARGLVYAAQRNDGTALQDFNTAIGANSNSVPALHQRARIYQRRDDFSRSLDDYATAIRLEPRNAVLWSERGYVSLRRHDYLNALKDEDQAIRLDPRLAWAHFLRGAAFGNLGDAGSASSDIKTAVSLDPSLANNVLVKDKTASLRLPPPPD